MEAPVSGEPDVSLGRERATPSVECIAALDTHRFDANDHALGMAYGIGNILVFEALRPPFS